MFGEFTSARRFARPIYSRSWLSQICRSFGKLRTRAQPVLVQMARQRLDTNFIIDCLRRPNNSCKPNLLARDAAFRWSYFLVHLLALSLTSRSTHFVIYIPSCFFLSRLSSVHAFSRRLLFRTAGTARCWSYTRKQARDRYSQNTFSPFTYVTCKVQV